MGRNHTTRRRYSPACAEIKISFSNLDVSNRSIYVSSSPCSSPLSYDGRSMQTRKRRVSPSFVTIGQGAAKGKALLTVGSSLSGSSPLQLPTVPLSFLAMQPHEQMHSKLCKNKPGCLLPVMASRTLYSLTIHISS
ncbi:hypothetical protein CY34DRAFT_804982 [Suillus luteus UH-Slu-Lm8-n1]|uniref:Uncharacterized protein n=1 Tax=Suillus luteus UH-Slu-Lm8-n1 TaxID=930992 RepID=A0A0C9ZXA2_9AGAM|nr:hypothetical protein CY34DRAFT_804982 [Suillus luteus UH-Slu-Lm8-n1]